MQMWRRTEKYIGQWKKADYVYMKNSIYLKITIKVLLKIYSLSNVQYLYLVNLNS